MPKHARRGASAPKMPGKKHSKKTKASTVPHALRKPRISAKQVRMAPYGAPPPPLAKRKATCRGAPAADKVARQVRHHKASRRATHDAICELKERATGGGGRAVGAGVLLPATFVMPLRASATGTGAEWHGRDASGPMHGRDASGPMHGRDASGPTHGRDASGPTDLAAALHQDAQETEAWARQSAQAVARANSVRNRQEALRVAAQARDNAFAVLCSDDDEEGSAARTLAGAESPAGSCQSFALSAPTLEVGRPRTHR